MKKGIVFLLTSVIILAFCLVAGARQEKARLTVFVSILPQAYFLECIGGQHIDVEVLVGEGQSPATYEPTPRQMAKLSSSRAFFAIGVPFERGLMKKLEQSYKRLMIVETQKGVTYRYLSDHNHGQDEKGVGKSGSHQGKVPDPHIWMDPKRVKILAQNILDALCCLDFPHKEDYTRNFQNFIADLDRTDKNITTTLAPLKGKNMYVFHPAFGYFAESYGLHQVPVEIEGKEPGAKELAGIIEMAKKDGVRVIFVQPQFSAKSAQAIARATGGAVIPINPLAKDYLANLDSIASAVEKGLR